MATEELPDTTAESHGQSCSSTSHAGKCPLAAKAWCGGNSELLRAVRKLYEDQGALDRRAWLLQPVRSNVALAGLPRSGSTASAPSPLGDCVGRLQRGNSLGSSMMESIGLTEQTGVRSSPVRRVGGPQKAPLTRPRGVSPPKPRLPTRSQSSHSSRPPRRPVAAQDVPPPAPPWPRERPASARSSRLATPTTSRPSDAVVSRRAALLPPPAPKRKAKDAKEPSDPRKEEEAKQEKQAKIKAWLQRKEVEQREKRLAEEAEAERQKAKERLLLQQKEEQQADLLRRRSTRLQALARRRQELELEAYCCPEAPEETEEGRIPTHKAGFANAIAAYSSPRPSSRTGVRLRTGSLSAR